MTLVSDVYYLVVIFLVLKYVHFCVCVCTEHFAQKLLGISLPSMLLVFEFDTVLCEFVPA